MSSGPGRDRRCSETQCEFVDDAESVVVERVVDIGRVVAARTVTFVPGVMKGSGISYLLLRIILIFICSGGDLGFVVQGIFPHVGELYVQYCTCRVRKFGLRVRERSEMSCFQVPAKNI